MSPNRPVLGVAVMFAGAAALWALAALVRRLPVDLTPISARELRDLLGDLPDTAGPVAALRHAEHLLVTLGAAAAVLAIVVGVGIAWRRRRIAKHMHVFGKRVA